MVGAEEAKMADGCVSLEPDVQIGGYECDFVEDPPDYLVCSICICPFKESHLVLCCGKILFHLMILLVIKYMLVY